MTKTTRLIPLSITLLPDLLFILLLFFFYFLSFPTILFTSLIPSLSFFPVFFGHSFISFTPSLAPSFPLFFFLFFVHVPPSWPLLHFLHSFSPSLLPLSWLLVMCLPNHFRRLNFPRSSSVPPRQPSRPTNHRAFCCFGLRGRTGAVTHWAWLAFSSRYEGWGKSDLVEIELITFAFYFFTQFFIIFFLFFSLRLED